MKILFVSSDINRGGAQRVISLLANEYANKGWSVHLAVLLGNKKGYGLNTDICVHDITHSGSRVRNSVIWIRDIRKIIQEEKPDVVVSFAGRINIITLLASCGSKIPVIVSERNDPQHDRRSKIERLLCKIAYSKADRVIFQTKYQSNYYGKWCINNSVIIGNPISAPTYEGDHPKKDIICVGKLMEQKNHPMMIRAFSQIADEFNEKSVYIYGDGVLANQLAQMIDKEGIRDRVHLCGNSDHIFDVMHENEYFVMCSNYEGMSNALIEAMKSGMICITTAWNGVEDIVVDGVNGYIVPIGDSEFLAKRMGEVFISDTSSIRNEAIKTGNKYECLEIISLWEKAIIETIESNNK